MVDQIDWTTTILEELFSSHPDRVRGAVLEGRGEEDKGVRSKERLKSWRIVGRRHVCQGIDIWQDPWNRSPSKFGVSLLFLSVTSMRCPVSKATLTVRSYLFIPSSTEHTPPNQAVCSSFSKTDAL